MMSEIIKVFRNKLSKWKEGFESNRLKVNLGRKKLMVSHGITKDNLPKSKVDPCWVVA